MRYKPVNWFKEKYLNKWYQSIRFSRGEVVVSVSDLLLVFGCTCSGVSGSVQCLELFEEVTDLWSECSVF